MRLENVEVCSVRVIVLLSHENVFVLPILNHHDEIDHSRSPSLIVGGGDRVGAQYKSGTKTEILLKSSKDGPRDYGIS